MSSPFDYRWWHPELNVMENELNIVHLDLFSQIRNGKVIPLLYTGLKDSKGNKIYEDDIIECWGRNLRIVWCNGDASFFAESVDGTIFESGQEWGNNCEVVGNIYQNKELLNEGSD